MYRTSLTLISFASASLLTMLACSSAKPNSGFDTGSDPTGGSSGSSGGGGSLGSSSGSSGSSGTTTGCVPDPANAEIAGNNCDDDGDGQVDNVKTCDSASTGSDANDFAKTMGICDDASTGKFGLVSATFSNGFGTTTAPNAGQYGALPKFGNVLKPREGAVLGILSTGWAGEYDSQGGGGSALFVPGKEWKSNGAAPPGYPKATAAGCDSAADVHDMVNLHLELKAPANATGFQFDFNFHSSEWPAYICSEFNDSFVAYLKAAGFNGGMAENMSFDSKNNPVSVNNSFLDRCTDGAEIGCLGNKDGTASCPAGTGELAGTGFGTTGTYCPFGGTSTSGGATGWLTSKAAVNPGETFTLDLMIWDTHDSRLDSLVLLDNFQWIGGAPVTTSTDRPK